MGLLTRLPGKYITFFTLIFLIPIPFLCAQEKGVDRIIFKPDAVMPAHFKEREVKCLVIEESGDEVKVDLSQFSGISDVQKIPKSLIKEVVVAERSPYEYSKIENKIRLPDLSCDTAYYEGILSQTVEPFLAKYPNTESARKVEEASKKLRLDKQMVELGWGRSGDQWIHPEEIEAFRKEKELELLLNDLKKIQIQVSKGEYQVLAGLADRVSAFKDNLYYPYLVKGVQALIRPAGSAVPLDLQKLSRESIQSLITASTKFESASQMILNNQQQQIKDPAALVEPLRMLAEVTQSWPQLEQLRLFMKENRNYFLSALWVAALQNDKSASFSKMIAAWKQLLGADVLPMEQRLASQKKVELSQEFNTKLVEFQNSLDHASLASMTLPEGSGADADVQVEFDKIIAFSKAEMTAASDLLKQAKAAEAVGNLSDTSLKLTESSRHWSRNPDLLAYRDEMLERVAVLITKRKRDEAAKLLAVLSSVWPGDSKVSVAEQNLEYSRGFLMMFDNFTYGMILFIGLSLIGIILGLRFFSKLFSDG
jgi:hypothetical protein